jgi:hypothetical protein
MKQDDRRAVPDHFIDDFSVTAANAWHSQDLTTADEF